MTNDLDTALLPPSTLLSTVPLLPAHTNPKIRSRQFASGLKVLHTPHYSTPSFKTRLDDYLWELGDGDAVGDPDREAEAEESLATKASRVAVSKGVFPTLSSRVRTSAGPASAMSLVISA